MWAYQKWGECAMGSEGKGWAAASVEHRKLQKLEGLVRVLFQGYQREPMALQTPCFQTLSFRTVRQ